MIKTIVFNGGIGNQMFQYAFYMRMQMEHPFSYFLFDIERAENVHSGFELDDVFFINSAKQRNAYARMKRCCPSINKFFITIKQKNCFEYVPQICKTKHLFTLYDGFWQNAEYFQSIEQQVRSVFSFRQDILNDKTKDIVDKIRETNSVSIHVRRCDYLQHSDDFGLCSLDFYAKAIAYIKEKISTPRFFLFSDDMEWVKQNIKCDNAVYVNWNIGNESWQDLYLMSCCKHNIIANSSFSWWGGWLNSNVNKIVIAPTPWVNSFSEYNFIPQGWVKIKK